MKKPVVVIGSINMDLVARVARIPSPGETLIGSEFTTTPGGKGANQAVAVARLGYPVELIGAVGKDDFGVTLLEHLKGFGVDVAGVQRVAGSSGVATITVAADGANSIVVVQGANAQVTPEKVEAERARIQKAGMVLCQLEIPLESVLKAAELAHAAGVPFVLDPAPAAKLPDALWKLTSWLTPNETEAAFYLDGAQLSVESAAQHLIDKGVLGVALKRGGNGSYLLEKNKGSVTAAAFKVKVVDTVGAGDCFNGAFAVGLMEGLDVTDAGRFASAAAAVSVTRAGAQSAMPSRAEVEALLAE